MSESTIKRYDRAAGKYEQRWEKYLDHTHNALLDRIEIEATDAILDASGGTGLLVRRIIERGYSFDSFVINDPSEQMLAVACQRFADIGNIHFGHEKAGQLSYKPSSFDKIICLNSFHFFQNQQQVVNQFCKTLKSGGTLYILDWNRTGYFRVVNKLIQWTRLEHIHTRSLAEIQDMLTGSGLDIRKTDSWNWRYWKLMFVEAYKPDS